MHPLASFVVKTVTAAFCALMVAVFVSLPGMAQDAKPLKDVALVIAAEPYATLPAWPTPARHARAMGELLAKLGMTADIATNSKAQDLRRSVDSFIDKAQGADVALLYYSGHAIEAGGTDYL